MDPPTAAFFVLSLVGLAGRLFWGRFLTVCFCTILALVATLSVMRWGLADTPPASIGE